MEEQKLQRETKEWRCPKCGRLLGEELGFNKLEIVSSNKQKIVAEYTQRWGSCKCGYRVREKRGDILSKLS